MGQPHDRFHEWATPTGATIALVQVTPQTHYEPFLQPNGNYNPDTYQYCAGYQYEDSAILGTSATPQRRRGFADDALGRPGLS